MSPRPNRKIAGIRATAIGAKATTPSAESRARVLANSIAATEARKQAPRRVDWDAVIERFRADMAERYADEEATDA